MQASGRRIDFLEFDDPACGLDLPVAERFLEEIKRTFHDSFFKTGRQYRYNVIYFFMMLHAFTVPPLPDRRNGGQGSNEARQDEKDPAQEKETEIKMKIVEINTYLVRPR